MISKLFASHTYWDAKLIIWYKQSKYQTWNFFNTEFCFLIICMFGYLF